MRKNIMNPYKPDDVIRRERVIRSAVLIIVICIGLVVSFLMRASSKDYEIEYISQEEILNFEKERAKRAKSTDLFFGKSADAISYIEEAVRQREASGAKVVFATEGIISGKHVVSISKEVYLLVIERLAKENPVEVLNRSAILSRNRKSDQALGAGRFNELRKSYNTKDGRYFKKIMPTTNNLKVQKEEADKHSSEELEYKYDEE